MFTLLNGQQSAKATHTDLSYIATYFNIPNRSKLGMVNLRIKIQELILSNDDISKFVDEYLHKKADEKSQAIHKRKEIVAQTPTIDLTVFVGKYFKAQASYMVRIYKVVGHTQKMLKVGGVKLNSVGDIHFPAYTIDEDCTVHPEYDVKLIEHEGFYFFKHNHFSFYEVDNIKGTFTCCEY